MGGGLLSIELIDESTLIKVRGDLDFYSSRTLATAIRQMESCSYRVIVSLSSCTLCDASGLSVIVSAFQRIGNRLLLVLPEHQVPLRVFQITRLIELLPIARSDEAAVRQCSTIAS